MHQTTIQPGELVTSDPVKFPMATRQNVAITMHLGEASSTSVTGHPGSRTDSYLIEGQGSDFTNAVKTAHWYIINEPWTAPSMPTWAVTTRLWLER